MTVMCERCYDLTEVLVLTEVEGTISNPTGVSLVLLCDVCRIDEKAAPEKQEKCVDSCAANPQLILKSKD